MTVPLVADPKLRVIDGGRVLIGHNPVVIVRLSDAGALVVRRWLRGQPPTLRPGEQALASRLIGHGMFHSMPNRVDVGVDVEHDLDRPTPTVVIPVKDDLAGLRTTLQTLRGCAGPIIIVDDGSSSPIAQAIAGDPTLPPVTIIRHESPKGPAAARMTGFAQSTGLQILFVDAGVVIEPHQITQLGHWLTDPSMAAVAPRVRTPRSAYPGWLDRYERLHSPLDMGIWPALVAEGGRISYLPSTCLLVQRRSFEAVGGFEPKLRFGEDVDLTLRLCAEGRVRYDPSIEVTHPARPHLVAFAKQRLCYGSAAGPLARRHGSAVAPLRLPKASSPLKLFNVLRERLQRAEVEDADGEAALLTAKTYWSISTDLATGLGRTWWPIVAMMSLARWRLAKWVVAFVALRWARRKTHLEKPADENTNSTNLPRLVEISLNAVDDISYGTGVWLGVICSGGWKALVPSKAPWPTPPPPKNHRSSH